MTECTTERLEFQAAGGRTVTADFDGGHITSDAGGALLGWAIDQRIKLFEQVAACCDDYRNSRRVEHSVEEIVAQRVLGLVLGYSKLSDHEDLRRDPALAMAVGKDDPMGEDRRRPSDRGIPMASPSTLNRVELAPAGKPERNSSRKIVPRVDELREVFPRVYFDAHDEPPERMVLDGDAAASTLHGKQLGRIFHGYYDCYCYLPLFFFAGEHLLVARLRPADIDASKGTVEELEFLVSRTGERWPETDIWFRGDSGFCREHIMAWCEAEEVRYVLGIARNNRLLEYAEPLLQQAEAAFETQEDDEPVRVFGEVEYSTLDSWSRSRRVIVKAEVGPKGRNPRFIVTNVSPEEYEGRALYEELYCARGEAENRIKEQQLYLYGNQMSGHTMRTNQIRLWLAGFAYLLIVAFRRLGLKDTPSEGMRCDTMRRKLFKIGALLRKTARRFWVHLSSAFAYKDEFVEAWFKLTAQPTQV